MNNVEMSSMPIEDELARQREQNVRRTIVRLDTFDKSLFLDFWYFCAYTYCLMHCCYFDYCRNYAD